MNRIYPMGGLLLAVVLAACHTDSRVSFTEHPIPVPERRMLNPIAPPGVFIADPEVRQMPDGRVYVYGSRDEPGYAWCSHSYDVLSSSDLVDWHVEQEWFVFDKR